MDGESTRLTSQHVNNIVKLTSPKGILNFLLI
jgi:hypothetical protein